MLKKREKIIGIVMLAVIAIGGIMYLPKSHTGKVEVITPMERPSGKPITVSGPKRDGIEPLRQFDIQRLVEQMRSRSEKIDMSSIRDPFKKLEPKISKLDFSDLVLSGIMWDEQTPLVIINNQILKEGDIILDFLIEEIRKDEVVLIKGTERYTLKVFTGTNAK